MTESSLAESAGETGSPSEKSTIVLRPGVPRQRVDDRLQPLRDVVALVVAIDLSERRGSCSAPAGPCAARSHAARFPLRCEPGQGRRRRRAAAAGLPPSPRSVRGAATSSSVRSAVCSSAAVPDGITRATACLHQRAVGRIPLHRADARSRPRTRRRARWTRRWRGCSRASRAGPVPAIPTRGDRRRSRSSLFVGRVSVAAAAARSRCGDTAIVRSGDRHATLTPMPPPRVTRVNESTCCPTPSSATRNRPPRDRRPDVRSCRARRRRRGSRSWSR